MTDTAPDSLLSDIYDCAVNPGNWEHIIDRSVAYAGAAGGLVISIPTLESDSSWSINIISQLWRQLPPEKAAYLKQNFFEYEKEAWQAVSLLSPLDYLPDNEAYPNSAEIENRADYVYLKENIGIRRKVAVRLNEDRGSFDLVTFQFHKDYDTIPQASGHSIRTLSPHFAKALEIGRTFNLLRSRYSAVLAALDHVDVGLCIVGPNRHVLVSNTEAERIFSDTGCVFLHNGKLKCRKPEQSQKLDQLIERAIYQHGKLDRPTDDLLVFKEQNHPVFLHTAHLRDSGAEIGEALDGVLVSIVDLSKAGDLDIERFSILYGLSAAETGVCGLLSDGYSNTQIADQRNVSPETVKSHIRSIFKKSNVSSRIELVRLLVKVSPPIVD